MPNFKLFHTDGTCVYIHGYMLPIQVIIIWMTGQTTLHTCTYIVSENKLIINWMIGQITLHTYMYIHVSENKLKMHTHNTHTQTSHNYTYIILYTLLYLKSLLHVFG